MALHARQRKTDMCAMPCWPLSGGESEAWGRLAIPVIVVLLTVTEVAALVLLSAVATRFLL